MFQFTLNKNAVRVEADKGLLEYLREDARLTSVKDGCDEGVCGSCSVLVNGKALRACTLTVAKVHGKEITTAEGIPAREEDVFLGLWRGWSGAVRLLHAGRVDKREIFARPKSSIPRPRR